MDRNQLKTFKDVKSHQLQKGTCMDKKTIWIFFPPLIQGCISEPTGAYCHVSWEKDYLRGLTRGGLSVASGGRLKFTEIGLNTFNNFESQLSQKKTGITKKYYFLGGSNIW